MKNNRGSSLILVIICIAFAGVLGTTVLMSSSSNRDMKLVDEMAKENFYQTESGLDIFMANLSQMAEEVMGEAYAYGLTHYSESGKVAGEVKKGLFSQLTGNVYSDGAEAPVKQELLEKGTDGTLKNTLFYGIDPDVYGTQLRLLNLEEGYEDLTVVADGNDIILKNLSIIYQENGYETKIKTDVRVEVKFSKLDVETPITISGKYMDYSIITDKNLVVMDGDENIFNKVDGNVYVGDTMTVGDNTAEHNGKGKLELKANKLIVGSEICTKEGGELDILGKGSYVDVWTKNIHTVRGGAASQRIHIQNANCYVADDMTLDAPSSDVSITGNYYGYTMIGGGAKLSDSSAIVINAGKSELDLSGLGELWLAGRSSIKVPSIYGQQENSEGTIIPSYKEIIEGEAVSYKGNQMAYLVPAECIKEYGHNPLTQEEYNEACAKVDDKTGKKGLAACIDTSAKIGTGSDKLVLENYVNTSEPCEVVPVCFYSTAEPLYYLYLNFQSNAKAQEYFEKYCIVNKERLETYASVLQFGKVKLPENNIKTNGTVLCIDEKQQIKKVVSETISTQDALAKQSDLKRRFSGLLAMLDENYSGVAGGSLVSKIVRMDKLPETETHLYFDADMKKTNEAKTDGFEVILTRSNLNLEGKEFRGIVIADGRIEAKGIKFTGMMLATGDIIVTNDAEIKEAETGDKGFSLEELIKKNPSLQRYFTNYPLPAEGDEEENRATSRNISVSLENWIKN